MSEEIKDIEQHSDMASEPTGAAAMIDYSETALMEADLDEVDAGIDDPQKWIQVDDFMAAMRKEHPWLIS